MTFDSDTHIYIATDHPFFHVAIAHVSIHQNVFQRIEVFVGHGGAGQVRLGNDLHQGYTGPVEIDAALPLEMKIFAHVLFQVRAGDANARNRAIKFKINVTVACRRLVVLGDLVILGHVRIEIILPIEFGIRRDGAIEQQAGEYRQAQGLFVSDRQDARQAQTDRADIGIRWRAKFIGAAAPHF